MKINYLKINPLEKKKNELLEVNSTECGYSSEKQWIETDDYACDVTYIYEKWENVEGYVCEFKKKYGKIRKYITYNSGQTWVATDEYGRGALLDECSDECVRVAVRWVYAGFDYVEADEKYTYYTEEEVGTTCSGTTLMTVFDKIGHYSAEGTIFVTASTGEETYQVLEEESCDCGYSYISGIPANPPVFKCGSEFNNGIKITSVQGDWSRNVDTFTSNRINHNEETIETIYFTAYKDTTLTFNLTQGSELNYDYGVIGKLDSTTISTSSTNYFYSMKGNSNATTSMTIPQGEHFIKLMYRKDGSVTNEPDNVIIELVYDKGTGEYEATTKYQQINSYHFCKGERVDPTEEPTISWKVYERNSCDCGYNGGDKCIDCNSVVLTLTNGTKQTDLFDTDITENKYKDNTEIKDVIIGECIVNIRNSAFANCTSITSIRTQYNYWNIAFIGHRAFSGCTSLISCYTLLTSTFYIGDSAFEGCKNLEVLDFGSELNRIGEKAFKDCTSIYKIIYDGTAEEFKKIHKGTNWAMNVPTSCNVSCTDGIYPITDF